MSAPLASTDETSNDIAFESPDKWFAGGARVDYDPQAGVVSGGSGQLNVFLRPEGDTASIVTFLPGFPDGSFGWARVRRHLPGSDLMPKLFMDFVGMGDSDKPKDYSYSTAERTDLVEAIWRALSVQSTVLVGFDFSSLVILEHLRRRLERAAQGARQQLPDIRGVFIFNGGLFPEGHTHPWYTTPMLRRLPKPAWRGLARSFGMFKRTTRPMWSKSYAVSDAEIRDLQEVLKRHDGGFYLAAAAGFVADHKKQGKRLDFGDLFRAYRQQFPFFIGGSREDPFEHRQLWLAEKLACDGLEIGRLPGGHSTTSEHPEALAALITQFVENLPK
jgi:pimeloyl-ACP methyl ester carboxylesterase